MGEVSRTVAAERPLAADLLVHVLGSGAEPDPDAVGGKAAALDRLARAGLPVPAGVCLTTAGYREYTRAHRLGRRVAEVVAAGDGRAALESAFHSEPLPDAVADALRRAVELLGPGALAVRSSARGEDGSRLSFAGAHESFLGVAPAAVESAVRGCWASLWSERAVAYRAQRRVELEPQMAVIVQALVDARASAVAFTRHPVTGSSDELMICCGPGTGEALMAGGESAATLTLTRAQTEVVELDEDHAPLPVALETARALAGRALAIERLLGCPVDVEAAFDGRDWVVLQARPVTTG